MSVPEITLHGRIHQDELMDIEDVTDEDLARCLRDLARVNVVSLGYRPTLRWLDRVAARRKRISVLDVGCGHGDMLRKIEVWGRHRGIETDLLGIDLNPSTIRAAQAATPDDSSIKFEVLDLFDIPAERQPDVVINALFAHHLSDAELLRFVRWMDQTARLGWFINDLHRHPVSAFGLSAIFALWPVHRFVRHDGPVSVRRAFVRDDFVQVAHAAGLNASDLEIRWWFPFRWGFGHQKREG